MNYYTISIIVMITINFGPLYGQNAEQDSSAFENFVKADVESIKKEHANGELFLYVKENLCAKGNISNRDMERYIDIIEYGQSQDIQWLCEEKDPLFETISIYYKIVQKHSIYDENIYILMLKTSKGKTCFLDFKILLEGEELPKCLQK